MTEQSQVSQAPKYDDHRKRTLLITSIVVIGLFASLIIAEYYNQEIASPHPPSGIEPATVASEAVVPATTILSLLPNISGYTLSYLGPDISVASQIGADAVFLYNYAATNSSMAPFQAVIEIGGNNLSTPSESMARNASANFTVFDNTNIVILERGLLSIFRAPVEGKFILFQNSISFPSVNESILNWIVSAPSLFRIQGVTEPREVIIWVISLSPITQAANHSALESEAVSFAQSIANYWAPVSNPVPIH